MYTKPRHVATIDVPSYGGRGEDVITVEPLVIEATWTRNSILEADELEMTLDFASSGIDPRLLRNARVRYALWDEYRDTYSPVRHTRFEGIATKVSRSIEQVGAKVHMRCLDWTTMFASFRPFPSGVLSWQMTLAQAWQAICDNTGYYAYPEDGGKPTVVSSVSALRDKIVFQLSDRGLASKTLGDVTPARYHALSAPGPHNADAWAVWQWCVGALGLMSWIDVIDGESKVIVADTSEHFSPADTGIPFFSIGTNIASLTEGVDASGTARSVLLRSYDPLTGSVIESVYPPPADTKVNVPRVGHPSAVATADEYSVPWIHDQSTLDAKARQVYELRSRQEIEGTITTADTRVTTSSGKEIDTLDIRQGDTITVHTASDPSLLSRFKSETDAIAYLVVDCGYTPEAAKIVVRNAGVSDELSTQYHVKSLSTHLGAEEWRIEIAYWNRIFTSS